VTRAKDILAKVAAEVFDPAAIQKAAASRDRRNDVSNRRKYPGIEAAYRRYRGEDVSVTCPGCGLAFAPEQKSDEPPPETAPEHETAQPEPTEQAAGLTRDQIAERALDESRGARAASPAEFAEQSALVRKHAADAQRERATKGKARPRSLAQIARDYYGGAAEPSEDVIRSSQRGGR
jgi:hypothetical protein